MSSPILVTPTSAAAFRPDSFNFEAATAIPQAAIMLHSVVSGDLKGDQPVINVGFVDDADATDVDEGDEITVDNPTLTQVEVRSKRFAMLLKMSSDQYRNIGTPEQLALSIARTMTFKSDHNFLSQVAPTSPEVAPVAGVTNWTGTTKVTGVSADGTLDKLIDLLATVRDNLANPTAWIMAPSTWAALSKLKRFTATGTDASKSNESLLGAGTDDTQRTLLGVPVDVRAKMAAGVGVLVDRTQIVSALSGMAVVADPSFYFDSDAWAIRALIRQGHTIPRPERIGVFTLA